MKKRVLSLFLAITLCLTLTPTGALAAEGQPPEQTVSVTQEAETDAGENASPESPDEKPTENTPAAPEKNTVDKETGKEAGQNEPTAEGENEPLALGLDDARQNAADGENGEAGGTPISEGNTQTEIWCVGKPDSIGRGYDGTTDGSTIPIDLTFTDGTDTFTLKERTGFTAKKTFDSADAGNHTVTVEIELIGDAAAKYKLKAGEETFTIGGYINKAYPKLNVSLSRTTCTVGEKILPLLSVEGAPEGAAVTYYYTSLDSGYSEFEGSEAVPAIDENTAISDPGTYYVYAKTGKTKNYEEERSTTVELTVTEKVDPVASVTTADGTETPYGSFSDAWAAVTANEGSTLKLLADGTLSGDNTDISKSITLDLNGYVLGSNGSLTVKNGAALTVKNAGAEKSEKPVKAGLYLNLLVEKGGSFTCTDGVLQYLGLLSAGTGDYAIQLAEGENHCTFGGFAQGDESATVGDLLKAAPGMALHGDNSGSDVQITRSTLISKGFTYFSFYVGPCSEHQIGEDGTCDYCGASYVASVTTGGKTVSYTSLDDALNAAQNGDTVTLLSDVDLGETYVTISKSITFDLGDKTLSSSKAWLSYGVLLIKNATVTVKNGTVKATGSASCAIRAYGSGASMTLEDVTATVTSDESSVMVGNFGSTVIKSGDYQGLYVGAKSQVTLEGGTFRPYMDTITTNENVKSIFWQVNETTDTTSRDCMELLGDGCVYVDETETQVRTGGGFNTVVTVQQGTAIDAPVAKIGDVEYASLSKAINAVQNGGTITLLNDLDLGNGAVLQVGSPRKNFTIDLASHTLSADGDCLIMLHNGSQLTLKNGTLDGSRCTSYEGVLYISSNSGPKLTLENVTAKNVQRSVPLVYVTNGTVEFDGGSYTGGVLVHSNGNAVLKNGTFQKGKFEFTIKVYISARIPLNASGVTVSASEITYGQMLNESKLTATGTMKHPGTGEEVKGTFAWTNPEAKPGAAGDYTASWTFTPAEGYEEYATATGNVTVKVNKATPAFTAPTAQENLTYTGQEQALITAGMTDYGTMQYSLTENGRYSQNIPTGTDAGAYTVWYRVFGDANHNDTAPASVAVSIGKKPLTITGVTAESKPYDGTKDAGITSVTFDGVNLNRGTDYTVTANFDDAGVGNGKNITATVTLIGQAAQNYALEQSSFPTTGSITKAAAPDFTKETALVVVNGHEKTYTVTLPALPTLETPKEYGAPTYELGDIKLNAGYYTSGAKVENGELTLPIQKNDVETTGSVGTATVVIKSTNYEDITLTVKVSAVNQIKPVPDDGTITATSITYGNELSASTITGTMQDPNTRDAVNGTFTWLTPAEKLNAGSHNAKWIFTPDESNGGKYTTNTGTATVTVNPKEVTVTITPNGGTYGETITPATATANDVVGEDNPEITLTYTGTANDGTKYNGTTPPTKAGTYTIKASTTNANYTLVANTATAEFTVAKRPATVTPNNQSKVYEEKDPDLTYAVSGVLDGETLKSITLTRAEGENAGKYAITATADADANPNYDVTFAEGTLTIEPKSIKGATVVLGKGLAANGAEQTQTVEKVLLDGKELPANSYTVAGNTATAPGSHTLTITAKGNYTGTVEQTYVIIPAKAEDAPGEEIAIGSGEVKVVVKSEGTVPPATLLTNKAELLAMLVDSGDITADELAQIADGASVDIALTVKEANVSAEIKTAMEQAAKGCTIGQYLDISLFKYMTVNGKQQDGVALHTTKNALTISVAVPDALINTNSAVNRTYCIVRNHEGTITVLDAAFDAASKTLTFKTERFSDYAIAYKDTDVPSSGNNPGSNNSSNGSETKKNEVAAPTPAPTPASTSNPSTITAMPQTGDTSNPTLYVVLLVASLLGLAVVFVCKKRNNK